MLAYRELGDAGRTFVQERLSGGKSLSLLLREGLDLTQGTVWAYLPPAMTDVQAQQFDQAGVTRLALRQPSERFVSETGIWTPVPNLVQPSLTNIVERFLREQEHAIAVWEDAQTEATDPWVQKHPEEPLLFVGDEVYEVLDRQAAAERAISTAMSTMVAWWGSPAVLAAPPAHALIPLQSRRAAVSRAQLQPLVDHVQLLFFLAYDAEGFVFWSPAHASLSLDKYLRL